MNFNQITSWGDVSWISNRLNDDFDCNKEATSSKSKTNFRRKRSLNYRKKKAFRICSQTSRNGVTNSNIPSESNVEKMRYHSERNSNALLSPTASGEKHFESSLSQSEAVNFSSQVENQETELPISPSEICLPHQFKERNHCHQASKESASEVVSVNPPDSCSPPKINSINNTEEESSFITSTPSKFVNQKKERKFPNNQYDLFQTSQNSKTKSSVSQSHHAAQTEINKSADSIIDEKNIAESPRTSDDEEVSSIPKIIDTVIGKPSEMSHDESYSCSEKQDKIAGEKDEKDHLLRKRKIHASDAPTSPMSGEPPKLSVDIDSSDDVSIIDRYIKPKKKKRVGRKKAMKSCDEDDSTDEIQIVNSELNMGFFDQMVNTMHRDVDTFKKIAKLDISIDWRPSKLHQVGNLQVFDPFVEDKCKDHYSEQECNQIKMRWERFCEIYDLDKTKPNVFFPDCVDYLFLKAPKVLLNFVRFIGQDLPNRPLNSIRKKFVNIYSKTRKGRFSLEEDEATIRLFNMSKRYKKNNLFLPVTSLVLHRTYTSILKRLQVLRRCGKLPPVSKTAQLEAPVITVEDLPENLKICVQHILEVSGCQTLQEVCHKSMTKQTWKKVSKHCGIEREEVVCIWHMVLRPMSCAHHPVDLLELVKLTFSKLFTKKVDSLDSVKWHRLSEVFKNVGPVFLFSLVCEMILAHVPEEKYSSVNDCISYFHNEILPSLRRKCNGNVIMFKLTGLGVTEPLNGSPETE